MTISLHLDSASTARSSGMFFTAESSSLSKLSFSDIPIISSNVPNGTVTDGGKFIAGGSFPRSPAVQASMFWALAMACSS